MNFELREQNDSLFITMLHHAMEASSVAIRKPEWNPAGFRIAIIKTTLTFVYFIIFF